MRNRWIKGLLVFAAIALILIVFSIFGGRKWETEGPKHYVAVITKSTASAYWKSVLAGVNAASTEYNLTTTFEGPENEEDYATQNEMVRQAVKRGAEVIVFSAIDYQLNAEAIDEAVKAGTKVIVIDSDVNSSSVSCRISTDNYMAGRMAGDAALMDDAEELKIGIVNFDRISANGQQREEGFRDVVKEDARTTIVDGINVVSTTEAAIQGTEKMLQEHPEINVIATFNEWTSLGVGYAIQKLGLQDHTRVVAFDSNVVSVGMLETGEVDALVVQNPYAMGYLGIEYAYRLIRGLPIEEEIDTATTLVTKDNMYEEECQKVLFTFD